MSPQDKGRGLARLAAWGLALFLGLLNLQSSADSCVWYADDDTIRQVQTGTNQITRVVPLKHPHRLVMNAADCGVWTLDKADRRLLRYSAEAVLEREIRVRSLDPRLNDVEHLHLDPYDDSLWVADDRRIYHLTSAGQLIQRFSTPGEIQRLRVALDGSLWVLGKRDLWRFDAHGKLLAGYTLGRHLAGDARYFEVDSLGGAIWFADDNDLAQLKLVNPVDPPLRIRLRRNITGFALDPLTGNVWVAQKEALLAYSRAGALVNTADLEALHLRKPGKLAFDPVSRSLWAGTDRAVSRFTDTGEFVISFPAKDGDEALGVPAFKVEPTLTLVRPPENGIVDRARPWFELEYRARCHERACDVPSAYLSSLQLVSTLNGVAVGPDFQFSADTNRATFLPANALPQGVSSFTARLTDVFGHESNLIDTTFTVDTIAPAFGPITPPAGTVLAAPQVTLQGSINELGASAILQNAQALNPQGPNPQFPQPPGFPFSWGLTLLPGNNPIQLSAVDPAGNAAFTVHTLVFSGAPQVAIQSPANGATIADGNVTVSGTWSGPPNTGITVNGVVAATSGNQYFANVPLAPGANTITVTATGPDGAQANATVQVTSSGASPTRVTGVPLQGIAPLAVTFSITSDQPIQSVNGEFTAGSPFSVSPFSGTLSFTYQQPGAHTAIFNVVRADGTTVTKTLRIVVQSVAEVDQLLRTAWNGFTQALVAQDKVAAMKSLTVSAQARYGRVFDALLASLPAVAASLSAPERGVLTGSVGEYFVTRQAPDGTLRLFLIYFIRDVDGVWRLDTM